MRPNCLIPVVLAGLAILASCGENNATPAAARAAAPTSAAPAAPAPSLADLPAPYSSANLENGKSIFGKCRNCHSVMTAEGHKVGPNLHGVFDRHPGSAAKFKYSAALRAFAEERWTPELVDHWLSNPGTFLPGNGMFFNGIGKPDDRRDVIAYLLIETRK
jgi:cytochrome c